MLGDITLLGLENGQCDDLTPYREGWRKTREGSLTAYVRAGRMKGEALVHLWTESGLSLDRKITVV